MRFVCIVSIISLGSISFHSCKEKSPEVYAGLSDTAKYVGINTCRQCHSDKYETFIHTGMGMSFDVASHQKSAAVFTEHAPVYDSYRNLNYFPHWKNDSLYLTEFRLEGKDTTYTRTEKISWIIGSGQHTNSHMINVNGYVYQAPATFYTQKRQWDLPPGFEGGFNTRFSRAIGLECMTCHNAYPEKIQGSDNKYSFVSNGIDCERCHGPGSAHVSEKLSGKITDIKKEIDYSIVNPSKLGIELQLDICQRCHIQGNAVLKPDKSFMDFRPGMKLSDVMDVYMPLFSGDENSHIMASHAERLKMSACFIESKKFAERQNEKSPTLTPYKNAMTCVTCHDPHVSVKQTDQSVFIKKCQGCHTPDQKSSGHISSDSCSESLSVRNKFGNNCIVCHMPKNGTIDIPHVTTTDHWIRKTIDTVSANKVKVFLGLACINNPKPDNESHAAAFLNYFEKFSNNTSYLDSAAKYLGENNSQYSFSLKVRLYYLKNDFRRVAQLASSNKEIIKSFKSNVMNDDAWTAYRIGESYYGLQEATIAAGYMQLAVNLAPYQLDFRSKLAGVQLDLGDYITAKKNYQFIIDQNPEYVSAYVNLGFLIAQTEKNMKDAIELYDKALALDPDNIQAYLNKAASEIYAKDEKAARSLIGEVLKRDRNNETARMLLNNLNRQGLFNR